MNDSGMDPATEPWLQAATVAHVQRILRSYQRWFGQDLLPVQGTPLEQARQMFEAPMAVHSHNHAVDPIFNYANRFTLKVYAMSWDEMLQTPSRLTADPSDRDERMRLVAAAIAKGWATGLSASRFNRLGQRFHIKDAVVWNVLTEDGSLLGQASTFTAWWPAEDYR
jgi:hypothetical protein